MKAKSRSLGSPQRSPHRFVVHVRLVLMDAPESADRFGVHQFENPLFTVGPFDELRAVFLVLKDERRESEDVK